MAGIVQSCRVAETGSCYAEQGHMEAGRGVVVFRYAVPTSVAAGSPGRRTLWDAKRVGLGFRCPVPNTVAVLADDWTRHPPQGNGMRWLLGRWVGTRLRH